MLDVEAQENPVALSVAFPSPVPQDADRAGKEVLRQSPSHVTCRVAAVNHVPILQVNGDGILPATHPDQHAVEEAVLPERTQSRALRLIAPTETEDLDTVDSSQAAAGAVFGQTVIDTLEALRDVCGRLAGGRGIQALLNRESAVLVDMLDENRATRFQTVKVDVVACTEQSGEFCHVFGQSGHGQSRGVPRIDDKTICARRITHGSLLAGAILHVWEFKGDQRVRVHWKR